MPRLHARRAETPQARMALRTVLTNENVSKALAEAGDPRRYDEARQHRLTRKDELEFVENLERLVLAEYRIRSTEPPSRSIDRKGSMVKEQPSITHPTA